MKTIYLLLLFPIFIFGLTYAAFFAMNFDSLKPIQEILNKTNSIFLNSSILITPIIFIWIIISFIFHKSMIFWFSWAKELTRKENPRVYNIVENLCISRWLPTPKIWILEDDSMNAFATGLSEKNARIVFSRWLLENLDDDEVRAVAGHELTHIINKDSLLMVVVIVIIWAVATIWEILLRIWLSKSSSNNEKDNSKVIFIVWWIVLLVLWYLIFPLVKLAISRKREFLADAWSVELTWNNLSMINALKKISKDAQIESIKKPTVAALCIENPREIKKSSFISNLLSTHPRIEDRIAVLEKY